MTDHVAVLTNLRARERANAESHGREDAAGFVRQEATLDAAIAALSQPPAPPAVDEAWIEDLAFAIVAEMEDRGGDPFGVRTSVPRKLIASALTAERGPGGAG